MFGREFKAAEHRRHIPPTQRVGYGIEPVGSRTADRWVLDDLAEMAGMSTRLSNGWEVLQTNGGGPVLFREFNDYDSGKVSPPDSPGGPWNWSVHARLYQVNVGSGAANTADEAMSMVEQTYAEYKRTASRKTAADGDEVDLTYEQAREILSDPSHDAYGKVRLYGIIGEGETAGQIIGIKSLQNLDRFAYDRIYTIERSGVPIFRARKTAAPGKCPKCDGMGRETYETDTGSLSTQTCTECGGDGTAKKANRRTSAVTWYDHSDQFGGLWATYQGSAPDSPNGMINEAHGMYRWYVSDSGTRGNQQTGEVSSLEEAKRAAEQALASLGVTASRTASRRTAFLDTIEIAEPRHRVAGWDWDDHLNGFIAAEAAREFTCSCGDNVPAPGYTDCRCGKRWNTYTISANGSKKMIAREVPVRENVVMAGRTSRTASRFDSIRSILDSDRAQEIDGLLVDIQTANVLLQVYEMASDKQRQTLETAPLHKVVDVAWKMTASREAASSRKQAATYHITQVQQDPSIVKPGDLIATDSSRGRVHKILPPDGMGIMVLMMEDGGRFTIRTSARKQAAPSSGADAIAQHFPGWRVDDDNGNFWEIHSPGGEHAFIHEEDGTYTLLMYDNTPDEFYATGLSFEDALAEIRAEGII